MCKYMNIVWKITKFKIFLEVYGIDQEKSKDVLPPKELGKCINWRFTLGSKDNCNFFSSWDIRKVKNFKKLKPVVEDKINNLFVTGELL